MYASLVFIILISYGIITKYIYDKLFEDLQSNLPEREQNIFLLVLQRFLSPFKPITPFVILLGLFTLAITLYYRDRIIYFPVKEKRIKRPEIYGREGKTNKQVDIENAERKKNVWEYIKEFNEKGRVDDQNIDENEKKKNKNHYFIKNFLKRVFQSLAIIFVVPTLFVYILKTAIFLLLRKKTFINIFLSILNILIGLVALSIIYKLYGSQMIQILENSNLPMLAIILIKNVFFYIPCLINDSIEYVLKKINQEKNTPNIKTYLFLILIELFLITTSFLIPIVSEYINNNVGHTILNKPIFLKEKIELAHINYNVNEKERDVPVSFNPSVNHQKKLESKIPLIKDLEYYNFAISSWIYINPQSSGTSESYSKDTSILNYNNGQPNIMYNGKENKIKVYVKSNDKDILLYHGDIEHQKWNQFVVNYKEGTTDLFINGELVATKENIIFTKEDGNIYVGTKEGIHGGICNVCYHKDPLSKFDLDILYNSCKNKTPPLGSYLYSIIILFNKLKGTRIIGNHTDKPGILDNIYYYLAKLQLTLTEYFDRIIYFITNFKDIMYDLFQKYKNYLLDRPYKSKYKDSCPPDDFILGGKNSLGQNYQECINFNKDYKERYKRTK